MRTRLSVILCLLMAPRGWGQASFTPLTIPPGGIASEAHAISDDGAVIAGVASDSLANYRPWRWTAGTGLQLMSLPSGYDAAAANGITAEGATIVGWGEFQALGDTQACVWTQAGATVQGLGYLPGGGFNSTANAISDNGNVIVGTSDSFDYGSEAFRKVGGNPMMSLGFLPNGDWSEAYGISPDGSVVVGTSTNANFDFEAFRWTSAGGMAGLGILSGDFESYAYAASAGGAVVAGESVGFDAAAGTLVSHAFRWTAATGMRRLPTPPNHIGGQALAMTSDGSTIGGAVFNALNQARAALWDSNGNVYLVQDLLVAAGLGPALAGWTLTEVTAMSADGRFIAGTGSNPMGRFEGFRAELPTAVAGDLNCDGAANAGDIPAFVLALIDMTAYNSAYPACDALRGDFNSDGQIDAGDIAGMVALVVH